MNAGHSQYRSGAAATEFAVALPILMLLALACADFGRVMHHYQIVSNAARTGAADAGEAQRYTTWAGADVAAVDCNGQTALHYAAQHGSEEMVGLVVACALRCVGGREGDHAGRESDGGCDAGGDGGAGIERLRGVGRRLEEVVGLQRGLLGGGVHGVRRLGHVGRCCGLFGHGCGDAAIARLLVAVDAAASVEAWFPH